MPCKRSASASAASDHGTSASKRLDDVEIKEKYADAIHAVRYCQQERPFLLFAKHIGNGELTDNHVLAAQRVIIESFGPLMTNIRGMIDYTHMTRTDTQLPERRLEQEALETRRINPNASIDADDDNPMAVLARSRFSKMTQRGSAAAVMFQDPEIAAVYSSAIIPKT